MIAITLMGVLALYRDEQQQKKWVRSVFGRFVSPKVVERLAENPERLVLGGEIEEGDGIRQRWRTDPLQPSRCSVSGEGDHALLPTRVAR